MNKKFLWGGSTSAFQFEGGGLFGKKGKSIYDIREEKTGIRYSEASDFYHHYKEDIQLLKEMGFNSFRMSIAWTRLYPTGIELSPNEEGITFYKSVFKELKNAGIEPVVTLFHWDMPQYLVDHYNGFKSREIVAYFERYCRTCFEEFGQYVKYWLTLNENNLSLLIPNMYLKAKVTPTDSDYEQVKWDCYYHSMLCHFTAVKLCHEILPDALIGNMLASAYAYPLSPKPEDVKATLEHNQATMWDDLDFITSCKIDNKYRMQLEKKGVEVAISEKDIELLKSSESKIDFISFSYYYSLCIQDEGETKDTNAETMQMLYQGYTNPYLDKTTFGWQIDPIGLRNFMNDVYSRYKLPLMIVENGCGVEDEVLTDDKKIHDDYRIDYLRAHIREVKAAVGEDFVPILGFLPWGVIDLYSASGNRDKRYGFIYVDYDNNFKRYKKDSFSWYQKVIESNGKVL